MKNILLKVALVALPLFFMLSPASAYDFEVDSIYYKYISLDKLTVAVTNGDKKYSGEVVIPSKVKYKNFPFSVVSVDTGAFSGSSSLTSVTLQSSITSIGQSAFKDCSSLASISLPNTVTEIGDSAFYKCI